MFLEGGKEPDGKEYEAGFAHDDIVAWHIEITTGYYHPHVGRLAKNGYIALPRRSRRMALTSTTSITDGLSGALTACISFPRIGRSAQKRRPLSRFKRIMNARKKERVEKQKTA